MWNLMNNINQQNRQTQRYTDQTARGQGVGGLGEKHEGIKQYKLVVTEHSQRCRLQHKKYRQECGDDYTWGQEGIGGSRGTTL